MMKVLARWCLGSLLTQLAIFSLVGWVSGFVAILLVGLGELAGVVYLSIFAFVFSKWRPSPAADSSAARGAALAKEFSRVIQARSTAPRGDRPDRDPAR